MRKNLNVILYLVAITLVIFYAQRLLSFFGSSSSHDPGSRAAEAHMDEEAYYALREVAGVQLGQVMITYDIDEASGRYKPRFTNEACLNLQADPAQLKKQLEALQDELHEHVLLLGPGADADGSGFITTEEGARFRDLFEFGLLAAHCFENESAGPESLARAVGLDPEGADGRLKAYRELAAGCPPGIRKYFPEVGE